MFSSLRFRLWLSYAFIIVTVLGFVAVILFIYQVRNPISYRQAAERLDAVRTVIITRGIGDGLLVNAAQRTANNFNVRVIQFSENRQVVFDTTSDKSSIPFPKAGRLGQNPNRIVRAADGSVWLYSMEQLDDGTYLMTTMPRPRISVLNIFRNEFLPVILQGGLLALLLSLVFAYFFARYIADPLQKVVAAARVQPSAEIKAVEIGGPFEVQELTRAFNAMLARMQASQRSQKEFVANVSHELKTPLTSIQGFSQALLDGTASSEKSRNQAAKVIHDESERMHRMVLDLLDLAKLDAGTADMTMAPVDIAVLLNAIVEKFMPQLRQTNVHMVVNAPETLQPITADGDRLSQVITNLIDNALKFTPNGGKIEVSASVVNSEMLIAVSDTGAGISDEDVGKIFKRFYQADPSRKGGEKHGAGLGLAIAHEIVQAHGGKIVVRSELNEGTTFNVFLPLNRQTTKSK